MGVWGRDVEAVIFASLPLPPLTFSLPGWRSSVAYAGFSKGGAQEIQKIWEQRRPYQKVPVFQPKIRWWPKKKGLHSDLVRFLAQNWMKAKKKVFAHRLCAQTFCPSYQGGAMPQFGILFYANYSILSRQPKGGAMAQWPLLNTPLTEFYFLLKIFWSLIFPRKSK